jgi:hypothetical protein
MRSLRCLVTVLVVAFAFGWTAELLAQPPQVQFQQPVHPPGMPMQARTAERLQRELQKAQQELAQLTQAQTSITERRNLVEQRIAVLQEFIKQAEGNPAMGEILGELISPGR